MKRGSDGEDMFGVKKRRENSDPSKAQGIPGSLRILIPEKSMKLIIGSGGENVKRIGGATGTFVNVSSAPFTTADMCTDHIVSINPRFKMESFPHALGQCTSAMKEVMYAAFPTQEGDFRCIFLVQANLAGLMIGKGGDRITAIRREFDVQISLQKPPEGQFDEEVTFNGTLENVERAVNGLNDAFRIYYPDEPQAEQARAQIAAAWGNPSTGYASNGQTSWWTAEHAQWGTAGAPNKGPGKGAAGGPEQWPADGSLAISSTPNIPLKQQQLRVSQIQLPSGMDPASFIGKGGNFMKELKAKCCVQGIGYIKRMHLERDEVASQATSQDENRMDFHASEGIFPYAVSQIFERFRQVERNNEWYKDRAAEGSAGTTGTAGSAGSAKSSEAGGPPGGSAGIQKLKDEE